MTSPLRIAVLISGSGTTLRNLLARIADDSLAAEIALVISSNPVAGGPDFARAAGVATQVIKPGDCNDAAAYSDAVFTAIRAAGAPWVVMAGFLKHVSIPPDYVNRVLNIHPSLIPAFCGRGLYGQHVHRAVLDYGAKVSGCTVHFVDQDYDHGPVILQRAVPVLEADTAETLAARVFAAECDAYPEALRLIAAGRVSVVGRRVQIAGA